MNDHGARAHSIYGASGAHRWFICPGSVRRCQGAPDRTSPEAEEGTRAHELLERALAAANEAERDLVLELAEQAPQEMRDHVADAGHFVNDTAIDGDSIILETSFELPSAAAPGQVFGTCDVVIISPSRRKMFVIDFKYGAGVGVEAIGNLQMRFYGLGALIALQPQVDEIELIIIQPRFPHPAGPIRSETITPFELLEFYADIEAAIVRAQEPDAPLVPGEKQCQFCNAKVDCPAYEKMILDVGYARAQEAFAGVTGITPATMALGEAPAPARAARLAHVLAVAPLIKSYIKDCEAEAFALMQENGAAIPGFKLVEAKAQRRWNDLSEQQLAEKLWQICDMDVPINSFFETKLLALTNAEKIVVDYFKGQVKRGEKKAAAEAANQAMSYLTTKDTSGKLTIALISDERPAVNRAQQCFGGVVLPKVDLQQDS